jgi:glutamine cyclotransferase
VWYQPYVLKIDPETGAIVTMFDLTKLVADVGADVTSGAVLNGIAYDDAEDVFYITGKLWNSVYKVRLVDPVQ